MISVSVPQDLRLESSDESDFHRISSPNMKFNTRLSIVLLGGSLRTPPVQTTHFEKSVIRFSYNINLKGLSHSKCTRIITLDVLVLSKVSDWATVYMLAQVDATTSKKRNRFTGRGIASREFADAPW